MTVTKTGTRHAAHADVVDALAIGQMADADAHGARAEWEKWEGVLIKVNNVAGARRAEVRSAIDAGDADA